MRKSKIYNTSIIDNTGARTAPVIIVGEYNGFKSGEILDANALVQAIKDGRIAIGPSSGTSLTEDDIQKLDEFRQEYTHVLEKIETLETLRQDIVGNAPEELDTLGEVAEAINVINEYHSMPKATVDIETETISI